MAGVTCPAGYLDSCGFVQALVQETPKFDKKIMEDVRPTDSWVGNVSTSTVENGTPPEITQDRFRSVQVNSAKVWNRTQDPGVGCTGNPCDPTEHLIGWGSDRLTYYEEDQHWATPLMCFKQLMHITHAKAQVEQIISKILRPATLRLQSTFLRKRHLLWAKYKFACNSLLSQFTYQWSLGGVNNDEEIWFDANVPPSQLYKLVPQMLQRQFMPLMKTGYAGANPFKETSPFIELVTDIDTCWELSHLGGATGVGGGTNGNGGTQNPSVLGNWRFEMFEEANKYWRYGFNGQIGNFMARVDTDGIRFNYYGDMGAAWNGGNGNRYRYQWIDPYVNSVTTGAGGAAGIGDDVNYAWLNAQYRLSQIHHKKGLELLVREGGSINPELAFMHQDMGGKWQFVTDNLGADENGYPIQNKRRDKGQFIADLYQYIRPLNTEWLQVFFHKGEQMPVPQINTYAADPGYPAQVYNDELPDCPIIAPFTPVFGLISQGQWGPYGVQDGPIAQPPTPIPSTTPDI